MVAKKNPLRYLEHLDTHYAIEWEEVEDRPGRPATGETLRPEDRLALGLTPEAPADETEPLVGAEHELKRLF